MNVVHAGFLQSWASCKCVVLLICNHPICLRQYGVFFQSLHFMSLQCFVTTTRAALTAHYSINPRLGLSLTHLPPSEDQRFRQIWVGLDIRKKECFHVPMWSLQMGPGTWERNIVSLFVAHKLFHHKMTHMVCVSLETGLERFGKELGLSRSKEYKPWSLHLSELP